jgi:hypothetical protein
MIKLLLIVFVFVEFEIVYLLYFYSNVGNIVIILLCYKNKFRIFFILGVGSGGGIGFGRYYIILHNFITIVQPHSGSLTSIFFFISGL